MNCWQMGATHKTETPKTNGKLHVSALKHIKTLTLFFTPTCDTVNGKTNDTSYWLLQAFWTTLPLEHPLYKTTPVT